MSQGSEGIQYPSDYEDYLRWKEQQLTCPHVSSDAREKAEKEEKEEKSDNKNAFERFLEKWIDSDWLVFALGCYNTFGGPVSGAIGGFFIKLPDGLPNVVVLKLEKAMIDVIKPKSDEFSVINKILCKYKDNLMDFIIYLFKYYGMELTGTFAYNTDEHNKKIARRLKKMYEIITNYFIGGPDLSDKSVRKLLKLKTRHSKIFNIVDDTKVTYSKNSKTKKNQSGIVNFVKRFTPPLPFTKTGEKTDESGNESEVGDEDEETKGGKRTRKNKYNRRYSQV
jgi:hypothetical protein